jgi:hypothetical protein
MVSDFTAMPHGLRRRGNRYLRVMFVRAARLVLEHFPLDVNQNCHRGIASDEQIRFGSFRRQWRGHDGEGIFD